jgi:hypothetical protein
MVSILIAIPHRGQPDARSPRPRGSGSQPLDQEPLTHLDSHALTLFHGGFVLTRSSEPFGPPHHVEPAGPRAMRHERDALRPDGSVRQNGVIEGHHEHMR